MKNILHIMIKIKINSIKGKIIHIIGLKWGIKIYY